MKSLPNYIAVALLSAGCLCCYYFNPFRGGSVVTAFLVQALGVGILYLTSVEFKESINKYKVYAMSRNALNILRTIMKALIYTVCGVLLLLGIKWSLVRFIALLFMWIFAVSLGDSAGYYIWRRRNRDLALAFAQQGEQERLATIEAKSQKQPPASEQEAAAPRIHEQEIPDTMPADRVRKRVDDLPDMLLAMRLQISDESALSEALAHPTLNALAAIQYEIAHRYGHPAIVFYRGGGLAAFTSSDMLDAQNRLLALAKTQKLCVNPAWTQSLIVKLGLRQMGTLQSIAANCSQEDVFTYQLLGVELQLAGKLGIAK